MNRQSHLNGFLSLKKTTSNYSYALEIEMIPELKKINNLEIELILYPYNGAIEDNRGVRIKPYDNYLGDLRNDQKTLYTHLNSFGANIFGLILGIMITLFFWIFNQGELFTLQSTVAIIGVYLVGKEIWGDIEQILIDGTEKWRIRYYPIEYSYILRSKTTLDLYADYASSKKNKKDLILAEKLDVVSRSNARELKLKYNTSDLIIPNKKPEKSIRLAVFTMNNEVLSDFEQGKVLISSKISLNKSIFGISVNHEIFQAIDGNSWGSLNKNQMWTKESSFEKITVIIGRIKFYVSSKTIPGLQFLKVL